MYVGAGAHASTHTKAVQPFSIIKMNEEITKKKKKEKKKKKKKEVKEIKRYIHKAVA